jgi:cell division FtsZ-interacting protein ZapD
MIVVKFHSYFVDLFDTKIIKMHQKGKSVSDVLKELEKEVKNFRKYIDFENISFMIIKDGRTLRIPEDLELIVMTELIIAPIISGG